MAKFTCLECEQPLSDHKPGCSKDLRGPREKSDEDYEREYEQDVKNQRALLSKNLRAAVGALQGALAAIDGLQARHDIRWVEGLDGPAAERLVIRALDNVFGAKAIAKVADR